MTDIQRIKKSQAAHCIQLSTLLRTALAISCVGLLSNSGEARVPAPLRPIAPQPQLRPREDRKPKAWITLSKETSYVVEPVDADGYIDYLAAVNQITSKDVTVDNNAAVLLIRATDPSIYDRSVQAQLDTLLGVKPVPVVGAFGDSAGFLANQNDHFGERFDSYVPWSEEAFPIRAKWLKIHEQALDLAIAATRRPRCYFPVLKLANAKMPHDWIVLIPGTIEMARGMTARALLRLHEGRISEAQGDLLACHRLARLVGTVPSLNAATYARNIEYRAVSAEMAMLERGKLSAAEARTYQAELRKLAPLPDVAAALDRGERLLFLAFATGLAEQQQPDLEELAQFLNPAVPADLLIDLVENQMGTVWDEGLRTANKDWDRWVATARMSGAAREKELATLLAEARQFLEAFPQPPHETSLEERGQWMGQMLVARMMPALNESLVGQDRTRMRTQMIQLGLALSAYDADVGAYPQTLDALVPKYCAEVPRDFFTGGPLHYRPQGDGYALYSVGVNGKDDDGHDWFSQPPGDDVVLPVGSARPAPTAAPPRVSTRHTLGWVEAVEIAGLLTVLIVLIGLLIWLLRRMVRSPRLVLTPRSKPVSNQPDRISEPVQDRPQGGEVGV
jgi:hypothetical protein